MPMRYHAYHAPRVRPGSDLEASASAALRVRRVSLSGVVPTRCVPGGAPRNQRARSMGRFLGLRGCGGDRLDRVPALPLIESLLVFAPLVFHGMLGLWFVATGRTLTPQAPYPRALRLAMRATASSCSRFSPFICPRCAFACRGRVLPGASSRRCSTPGLSTTSHGVPVGRGSSTWRRNGLRDASLRVRLWGFYATTRAGRESARRRRWAAWSALGLGLAMWATFADVVVLRATGSALLGGAPPGAPPRCPVPRRRLRRRERAAAGALVARRHTGRRPHGKQRPFRS